MKKLLTIVGILLTAGAFAAPTANEDFVLAEDAQTYTNAVRAAKDYTDAALADVLKDERDPAFRAFLASGGAVTGGVTVVEADESRETAGAEPTGLKLTERGISSAWTWTRVSDNSGYWAAVPFALDWSQILTPSKADQSYASLAALSSVSSDLVAHASSTANPHKVTAAQAGAVPTSRKVNGKALSADVTLGAADVGAYTKAQSDNAYYPKDEGDLWAAWWSGDGFRVTVTNYNVTPAADVPWSRLPSVRFDYRPDGIATNPLVTVWSEETKWTRWRGEFAVVTNDFRAALDLKAGLDWGRTSPTGFDAPEGFTWLDTPATVISGGLAWQKTLTSEGAFWVLSSNGMVAQFGADGASTNGYFRITDERGNAVFEIVAGDKVTVGADPASVHTWQHTDGRTRLRVVYEIDSDTAPTLYAAKSLVPGGKTDWRALGADGCAALAAGWTGARGAWTNAVWLAEAPASSADDSLFVCATYEQGGETVVKNHAAVSMEKLVFGGKTYTMGTATIDGHTVLTLTEAQ